MVVRHVLTHSHKTHWSLYGMEQMAYREPALAQQPCTPRGGGGNLCTPQNPISFLFHHSHMAAIASKKDPQDARCRTPTRPE